MRDLRTLAFSAIMGLSLAACSQGSGAMGAIDVDPKTIEAHVAKLAAEAIKGEATTAADIGALRDALPPEVALSWGNLAFDQASGSTVLTAVKLTPKDMPTIGISIDELRLFDLDVELLKARFGGQRLGETAPLARRIDARGVSLIGIAGMLNQQMNSSAVPWDAIPSDVIPAPTPAPTDPTATPANPLKFEQPTDPNASAPAPEWPSTTEPELFSEDDFIDDDFFSEPAVSFEKYDISLGRVIFDDIVLKPFQVAQPAPANANPYDPMATIMPMLQGLSALTQSYGVDTAAYFDAKFSMAMTQFGERTTGEYSIAAMGARGMRGGDVDGMFLRDMKFLSSTPVPDAAPLAVQYSLGTMTLEDMRLGKVIDYLAKGVVPPRTESNLLSFGVWRTQNESMKMAGREVYSVGEGMFDASGWHWFIPTNLRASGKNASIDLGAFMDIVQQMAASSYADYGYYDDGSSTAQMQQVVSSLNKHGLSKIAFNYDGGWNWNAGNGDTRIDLSFDGDKLLKVQTKYEGAFPSFKAVSDLIPENPEDTNAMAIANVFQTSSALRLIEINLEDKGGLPRIYGMMGDMAPMMGLGDQPMTAENVRTLAASGLKTMAAGASTQIPEIPGLLNPIANFLETGGKLRLVVQPGKQMPFAGLAMTMMGVGMGGSPSQAIKDLGLKAEHSK